MTEVEKSAVEAAVGKVEEKEKLKEAVAITITTPDVVQEGKSTTTEEQQPKEKTKDDVQRQSNAKKRSAAHNSLGMPGIDGVDGTAQPKRLSRAERAKRRKARVIVSADLAGLESLDYNTELSVMEEIAASLAEIESGNAGITINSNSNSSAGSRSRGNTRLPPKPNADISASAAAICSQQPSPSLPGSSLAKSSSAVIVEEEDSSDNDEKSGAENSNSKNGEEDEEDSEEENEVKYQELLAAAKKENFSDLREADFLYRSNYDSQGRSIVVLIGSNLPGKTVSLEHLLLYIIYTLDSVVEKDYVVAYFASNQNSANRPPFTWIRKAYKIFDRKYKKNLKQLYIVQPTAWLRMTLRFLGALVSKKVWQKILYLSSFEDIYAYMSPSMLRLPANFVEKVTTMQPVFGEPLERTVSNPALQHNGVPIIVSDCITYLFDRGLDKVGLLRLSGNRALMDEYRMAYDSGKKVALSQCKDPHTVANLLK